MARARISPVLSALLFVVAVVTVLLALLWTFQRRLIYLPLRTPVPPASVALPVAREVSLTTADRVELAAWYVPPDDVATGMAVLVAPGNAGDRSARARLATALAGHGLGVLLFDYRGYGGNRGRPTQAGLARDARAALRFLCECAGLPRERLLYYGESLGTGVVTELATEHAPAGLVLRSPFIDLASVGRVHYPYLPVRMLLRDRFPVAAQLARVPVPTVVIYGSDDSIVPPEQSRAVAASAAGATRVVEIEGADHNDPRLLDGVASIAAVVELAARCRAAP
jgi:uncharacterized protein